MPVISVDGVVVVERQPGADADLEDAPADLARGARRGAPAVEEHRPAQHVVDRRPAGIGFFHHLLVGIAQHRAPSRIEWLSFAAG